MAKTIFEEMGGAYVRQGDYDLPCRSLPTEKENRLIGVWGQRHLRYLKQHRKVLYTNLLTSGKLNSYLADIGVWIGEKFQSNPEIAGSPRNSFRASVSLDYRR